MRQAAVIVLLACCGPVPAKRRDGPLDAIFTRGAADDLAGG
jgi:DNA mismatch repair ATPase MutS